MATNAPYEFSAELVTSRTQTAERLESFAAARNARVRWKDDQFAVEACVGNYKFALVEGLVTTHAETSRIDARHGSIVRGMLFVGAASCWLLFICFIDFYKMHQPGHASTLPAFVMLWAPLAWLGLIFLQRRQQKKAVRELADSCADIVVTKLTQGPFR
jgi:Flp pilus assembly protein TadB